MVANRHRAKIVKGLYKMSYVNPAVSVTDNINQLTGTLASLREQDVYITSVISQLQGLIGGETSVVVSEDFPVVSEVVVEEPKRSRGRPKGSKNKSKTDLSANEKRAAAWTQEAKDRAARRMRRYWRQRRSA